MKPVTEYTDRELSAEADAIASRIATGKVEGRDAVLVVELAIRLDRLQVSVVDVPSSGPTDEAVLEYCDQHPDASFADAVAALESWSTRP